jgi:hypothetical protein
VGLSKSQPLLLTPSGSVKMGWSCETWSITWVLSSALHGLARWGGGEGHEHGEVQHGVVVGCVGLVDAEVAVAGERDLDVSKAVHARVMI